MTTRLEGGDTRRPGVLLVDHDPVFRSNLARGLEAAGWCVWPVDEAAAVETFQSHCDQIDVALVDLQFPGLQGGRLLAELGQIDLHLARCAMSDGVSAYTASAFRRLSGTPLLSKTLDPNKVAATLHEFVLVSRS